MSDPKAVTIWSTIEGIGHLAELALNLHWSWNHALDQLWEHLDADLWEATQNPWVILQTVSKDKIKAALAEPEFPASESLALSEQGFLPIRCLVSEEAPKLFADTHRIFQHGVHVERISAHLFGRLG